MYPGVIASLSGSLKEVGSRLISLLNFPLGVMPPKVDKINKKGEKI
jgi:hypothetical protein